MLKVCGRHATFTTEVRPLTNEFRFSTDCLGRQRSDIFIMRSALTLLPLTLSPTSSRGKPQRWIKVKLPVNCGPERCERGALQTELFPNYQQSKWKYVKSANSLFKQSSETINSSQKFSLRKILQRRYDENRQRFRTKLPAASCHLKTLCSRNNRLRSLYNPD